MCSFFATVYSAVDDKLMGSVIGTICFLPINILLPRLLMAIRRYTASNPRRPHSLYRLCCCCCYAMGRGCRHVDLCQRRSAGGGCRSRSAKVSPNFRVDKREVKKDTDDVLAMFDAEVVGEVESPRRSCCRPSCKQVSFYSDDPTSSAPHSHDDFFPRAVTVHTLWDS